MSWGEREEALSRAIAIQGRLPNVTELTKVDDMSENENTKAINQVRSLIQGMAESQANFQAGMQEKVSNIERRVDEQASAQKESDKLMRSLYAKVTNGITDRLEKVETWANMVPDKYATKDELNRAANSIRGKLDEIEENRQQREKAAHQRAMRTLAAVSAAGVVLGAVAAYVGFG
jgi:hypothetical protein